MQVLGAGYARLGACMAVRPAIATVNNTIAHMTKSEYKIHMYLILLIMADYIILMALFFIKLNIYPAINDHTTTGL